MAELAVRIHPRADENHGLKANKKQTYLDCRLVEIVL
jgi:hypothetical protein